MAAGVAHEINNPLAFILSNLNSLKTYADDAREVIEAYRRSGSEGKKLEEAIRFQESLDDVEPLIRETAEGGERVRNIVQELKTFSRADQEDQLESVDLADIARSTLLLTERELSTRAKVVKDLKPAMIARAPRGRLHQMLLNLLINALHAVQTKGQRPHVITVTTGEADGFGVLSVSDTGCGISPEHQQRIFEPFFTTKAVGVGTGMGLAVCAMVVEKLGGRIEVQSEPGLGSTFRVRIPLQGSTELDEDDAQAQVPPREKERRAQVTA
jgi:signal transduction histidine kinase